MGTSLQRIFRSILTTKAREWHGSEPTNIKHPRARRGSSLNNLSLAGDIRKVKFDDAFNADGLHGLVSFGMSHHSVGVCYVTYVFTFKNVFPPCQAAGRSAPIVADGRTPLQWRTLIFPRTFYKSSGCSSSSLFSTQQMIRQLQPGKWPWDVPLDDLANIRLQLVPVWNHHLPKACVCFVRERIRIPIRTYSTKMTVIGMMKKTHVDTSQMGNPLWPFSSMPQNADSGMSSLPVRKNKKKLEISLDHFDLYLTIPSDHQAILFKCFDRN